MPKLWILNHYAIGPGESGGTRHFDFGRELVKMGWDVTIFAASVNHIMQKDNHLQPGEKIKKEVHSGVCFIWLKTPGYSGNGLGRIWNMLVYTIRVLRNAWNCERPEVIMGSSVHLFAVLAAYILSRHYRCRFIFEVRDLWPQAFMEIYKLSEYNPAVWLLRRLEIFLYKKAQKIIVLLPRASEYIERFGISKEKIFYVPNGVHLSRYREPLALDPDIANLLDSITGKFIAVYIGSLGVVNGLDTVLDVARILQSKGDKRIHFLLVGNGSKKKQLQLRAAQEKLANITFSGPVAKDYIPALLQKANIGIHAFRDLPVFRWGISPNKLFDYMAAGLPVLLLSATACENPVSISGGGIVLPSGDAETLVNTISNLADYPEKCAEMGEKSSRYVAREHAIEVLGRRLAEILIYDN